MGCFQSQFYSVSKVLERSDYKSGKPITFTGKHVAKIVKVYDGDTCTANVLYKGEIVRLRIRMLGYDSAEISSKDPSERTKAQQAKEALTNLVFFKIVLLDCHGLDKYCRVLANIHTATHTIAGRIKFNTDTVNNKMLSDGHGVPYRGGKRPLKH